MNMNFPFLTLEANRGSESAVIDGAETIAIPTLVSGVRPKFLYARVVEGTAGNLVVGTPGYSGTTALTNVNLVFSNDDVFGVVFDVTGFTHFGVNEISGVSNSKFHLYPLADF